MKAQNVIEIRELAANSLPSRYDPLNLTFYGNGSEVKGGHLVIGNDYGTDLCVDLGNGAVYSIDPHEDLPTRFINSGIRELARFIEVSDTFPRNPGDAPEFVARQMREEFTQIDAKALENAENWWVVVLEQLSSGL